MKIIGTNHLMKKEEVEELIRKENPDIIAIELCDYRIEALLNDIKQESKSKTLLGKITDKIREKAIKGGLDYGSDMKAALNYANLEGVPYEGVDLPILKIQELFSKIPQSEQEGFAKELQEFESQEIKENVSEQEVLSSLKQRYPIAFEFLVNMRNLFIANSLLKLKLKNPNKKIVAILGSAHSNQVNLLVGRKNG